MIRLDDLLKAIKPYVLRWCGGYETGSWTPTFGGSTSNGTLTHDLQYGYYTRLGDRVFIDGLVRASAITVAPTGDLHINGLPFDANSATQGYASLSIGEMANITLLAGTRMLCAHIPPDTQHIQFVEVSSSSTVSLLPASALVAGGYFRVSGCYRI